MAWNVIACLHGMDVITCLQNMVDKLAFMAWLLACLRGMDGKELRDDGSDVLASGLGPFRFDLGVEIVFPLFSFCLLRLGFMDKGDSGKDSGVSDAGKPRMATSPRARNYSPLVSPIATINMLRGLFNVDVATTFRVPLTIVGDLDVLTKDIQAGKHEKLLSRMTNEKRTTVMDALVAMCDSIEFEPMIILPSEVSPSDHIV
ncbi:hypothetical protein Tco_0459568 [Tanacetum coccineum]